MTKFIKLFTAFILSLSLVACSTSPKEDIPSTNSVTLNEKIVDEIKERGYINVGCKSDVPGLGLYNQEEAKQNELAHIQEATVATREDLVRNGDIDILLATYTITEERKNDFALSNSYYTDYIGLMVNNSQTDSNSLGSSDIQSLANLDGKRVGVARQSTTRKDMLEYIDTMNTIKVSPIFCEYTSYTALYKALKKGDIDVIAVDVSILNGYLDASTKILSDRFSSQHYGAATTLENQKLIDVFNTMIAN